MAIKNEFNWKVSVEAGRHKITEACAYDTIYSESYGISNAMVHSGYDHSTNANDIGLVKTERYIRFK